MNQDRVLNHTLKNHIHTIMLFAGSVVLLGLLGLAINGIIGFLWAIVFCIIPFLVSFRFSPFLVLKMYRARLLSPNEAPELYNIMQKLGHRANLSSIPRIFLIQSKVMNAFSVGSKKDAAIGVTVGLLCNMSLRGLNGIMAHEISHIRNNDMQVMGIADIISRITIGFSIIGLMLFMYNLLGISAISWPVISLLIAAPAFSNLMQTALSRTREFEADLDAAGLTGDPRGLAIALQRLENYQTMFFKNFFMPGYGIPDPSLIRTHPHIQERVKRLLELDEQSAPHSPQLSFDHEESYFSPSGIDSARIKCRPRWHINGLWY